MNVTFKNTQKFSALLKMIRRFEATNLGSTARLGSIDFLSTSIEERGSGSKTSCSSTLAGAGTLTLADSSGRSLSGSWSFLANESFSESASFSASRSFGSSATFEDISSFRASELRDVGVGVLGLAVDRLSSFGLHDEEVGSSGTRSCGRTFFFNTQITEIIRGTIFLVQ